MHFVQSDMLRVFAWPDGNPSEMIHYSFALVVRYLTFGCPPFLRSLAISHPNAALSFSLMLFVSFYFHGNRSLIIVHVDNVNEPYFVRNYFTFCCLLMLCDIKCCSRFNAFCVRSWICFTILVVAFFYFFVIVFVIGIALCSRLNLCWFHPMSISRSRLTVDHCFGSVISLFSSWPCSCCGSNGCGMIGKSLALPQSQRFVFVAHYLPFCVIDHTL